MKAAVFTLGCKVNEVESAAIMAELEKLGFEVCDSLCPADIYVLNTCAVTAEAERKSRQLVARAKKFNPSAPVFVCGCAAEKDKKAYEDKGVQYVGGARNKQEIVSDISRLLGLGGECHSLGYPKQTKTRAFVKIQDGCNNFCSYCIIPYLRGRITSRRAEDIVSEISGISSPEIVLTGIDISSYGKDFGSSLTDLIKELKDVPNRLRLGSLECSVITQGFLDSLKGLKDFAPQFHLSLQSGSDKVLRAMNRHYTRSEYLQKCRLIYNNFPDAAITTDIIAGFCGESEEDFKDSLSIIEEAGFARIHAFAFSPREGTKAYNMPDLPAAVKSERLHALLKAGGRAAEKYIADRLGSVQSAVLEEFDGQYTCGYTAGYIKVYVEGKHEGKAEVRLEKPFKDGAIATLV